MEDNAKSLDDMARDGTLDGLDMDREEDRSLLLLAIIAESMASDEWSQAVAEGGA